MIAHNFATIYAHIDPARIYFLRFILEGYDGLATLSTISPKAGMVVLKYPEHARPDLLELLDSMEDKLTTDII